MKKTLSILLVLIMALSLIAGCSQAPSDVPVNTEEEKYLIKLRFYDKMTSPAMGELLGMSDGVVRMTILRILKKLRKEIEIMQRRDEDGR